MKPSAGAALAVILTMAAAPGMRAAQSHDPARVAPGQRGVVRTVLHGDAIIEIPVEFLGLYEDAVGPGHDLYLVRLDGEDAARVGVAAGMSGSPVYFDDEIVGALSYRMGFLPTEAVAGVTPIDEMLDASRASTASAGSAAGVAPIATPLFVSGFAAAVVEHLRPELESMGFVVMQGGGSSADDAGADARPLAPGSPVGIPLVRGDVTIAATGTVTLADERRVLAFGHPLIGSGRVELPMARAHVIHTLADRAGSVKLARVGSEVGAILEDRLTAVVGRPGMRARMIPMSLAVRGGDHPEATYRFEVARLGELTPVLAGAAIGNALQLNLGFDREATVRVTGRLLVRGLPAIPVEISLASGRGLHPYLALSGQIQQLLAALLTNRFAEPDIVGLDLEVDVRRERREYRLESVHHDRDPVVPGGTLEVECRLRSFRGEVETRVLHVPVPADAAAGTRFSLVVGGAPSVARALGNPLLLRLRSAQDLATYAAILGERSSADRLVAALIDSAGTTVAAGRAFTQLPPTVAHLLDSGHSPVGVRVRVDERMDGPVDGLVRSTVEVDGRIAGSGGNP